MRHFVCLFFHARFWRHYILMLGRSPVKWRHDPDMTIVDESDGKPHLKQYIISSIFYSF